ncbi:metallophosphoesterase family protein, partial [Candidatus Hydrogenedentota bacterium]
TSRDIRAVDLAKADIVFYGHTHSFYIEKEGSHVIVNPGHLKSDSDKGAPPSLAILDIEKDRVAGKIVDTSGKTVFEREF